MILVSGLINLETTLPIAGFPLPYYPVTYHFGGVGDTISGVGVNIAKALHSLGNPVRLVGLTGTDYLSRWATESLADAGLGVDYLLPVLTELPRSVILYEGSGRRQIHLDLKEIQETRYPEEAFRQAAQGCEWGVLSTVNFNRYLLPVAQALGLRLATDVQALGQIDDTYNGDFLQAAEVLFASHENAPTTAVSWLHTLLEKTPAQIIGLGMGAEGALLAVRGQGYRHYPAVPTRPIVNSIGAGDALFSAFLHSYTQQGDPWEAMARAMLFASWKIGSRGAAEGFLTAVELEEKYAGIK
jgi:acarbose 7IV-phosphotransferase